MKTRVLHLSDTTLSGSPIRIAKLINKYSKKYETRHLVWQPVIHTRVFEIDLISSNLGRDDIIAQLEWADIIHYHNRYARQEVFTRHDLQVPKKPGVIQMHSPRESEDFSEEVASKLPIAVLAQYHTRQWPEAKFIVPNVVDIFDPKYTPADKPVSKIPTVSYAPSNCNNNGWNDKGYGLVSPTLKRMKLAGEIYYQLIVDTPHAKAMELKRISDIGIDEICTGSYHLSSLEYLSMGVPCFARLDKLTADAVIKVTGCEGPLPWLHADKHTFKDRLERIIRGEFWPTLGIQSRLWMERYFSPSALLEHYENMYKEIV